MPLERRRSTSSRRVAEARRTRHCYEALRNCPTTLILSLLRQAVITVFDPAAIYRLINDTYFESRLPPLSDDFEVSVLL